ncbi:unnamed protein product, partial [Ectocarpus sp. 12 AP-2014]
RCKSSEPSYCGYPQIAEPLSHSRGVTGCSIRGFFLLHFALLVSRARAGCLLLVNDGQDIGREEQPDKIAKITTSELSQRLLLDSEEAFLSTDGSVGPALSGVRPCLQRDLNIHQPRCGRIAADNTTSHPCTDEKYLCASVKTG